MSTSNRTRAHPGGGRRASGAAGRVLRRACGLLPEWPSWLPRTWSARRGESLPQSAVELRARML
eukprot:3625064-Alexandrium_andersonii.AAC.1